MQLFFQLQKEKARIVLREGEKERDMIELEDIRSLSQTLLPAVDALLKRHQLTVEDLTAIDMTSEVAPVFTSYRIVEATMKSLFHFFYEFFCRNVVSLGSCRCFVHEPLGGFFVDRAVAQSGSPLAEKSSGGDTIASGRKFFRGVDRVASVG